MFPRFSAGRVGIILIILAVATSQTGYAGTPSPGHAIRGEVGLTNTSPEFVSVLSTSTARVTVPGRDHHAGEIPAGPGPTRYEILLPHAGKDRAFEIIAEMRLGPDGDRYFFEPGRVTDSASRDIVVDFVECAGTVDVMVVDSDGLAVPLAAGAIRAWQGDRMQAEGVLVPGASRKSLRVRAETALRLEVSWSVEAGGDEFLSGRCARDIQVDCDGTARITCTVPGPDDPGHRYLSPAPALLGPGTSIEVRQGTLQFPIEPITGSQDIVSFYAYGTVWNASAFTGLETSDTSILFFYEQGAPGGPLSLVVIHDIYDDGDGGQVRFDIDGLPPGVVYGVQDDPGGFGEFYTPDPPSGGSTTANWNWVQCCTDGLALTGFEGQSFCVSVRPSFMQGIFRWEAISGPNDDRTWLPNLTETTWLCCDCAQLDCEPSITAECEANGSAFVSVSAAGSSLCSRVTIWNDRTPNGDDASDSYPLGSTAVQFTQQDVPGFVETCTSTVTVEDTTPPFIDVCPEPLRLPCEGQPISRSDSRIQAWIATFEASDRCGAVTLSNDVPSEVPVACNGAPIDVTFSAVDETGLVSRCPSSIVQADAEPPRITSCPDPEVLECDDPAGIPSGDPRLDDFFDAFQATDDCVGVDLSNDAPPLFPSGCHPGVTTPVSFQAEDGCGKTSDCSSAVTARDSTPPEITECPTPLDLECEEQGGVPGSDPRIQGFLADFAASDLCGGVTLRNDAPSFYPYGCGAGQTTDVRFEATDDCGLRSSCISGVTVHDTTPPAVTNCPQPVVMECEGPRGVPKASTDVQSWLTTFEAADICDGALTSNDAPDFFPWGCGTGQATTVTFTARDDCDNASDCDSTLTVRDTEAPGLGVPDPLVLECEGPAGIPATDPRIQAWLASATGTDACSSVTITDDAPTVFLPVCSPADATVVNFQARDACGNTTTLTSTVTVIDTTPPDLTVPPPLVLECDGPGGIPADDPRIQAWIGSARAGDTCGGATLGNDAPAFFPSSCPPGTPTPIRFFAVDECGLRSEASSSVTVVDSTPPEILEVPFDGICLWSPNHKYFCVADAAARVTAADTCDTDPPEVRLVECGSSQPDDDLGDGHTTGDCVITGGGTGFCVRSERQGVDPEGRDYGLVVAAVDGCGNTSLAGGVVHVPHDDREHPECFRANEGKTLP